jgi:hypothetical protein
MLDAFKYYNQMKDDKVIFSFKGVVTEEIISNVLDITENKLLNQDEKSSVRKKVFRILVEVLQNLYHHTKDFKIHGLDTKSAIVLLYIDSGHYNIVSGNYIDAKAKLYLEKYIGELNQLDNDSLREFYKNKISEDTEASNNAGLGLIDIRRKTGKPIEYITKNIKEDIYFISLNVKI